MSDESIRNVEFPTEAGARACYDTIRALRLFEERPIGEIACALVQLLNEGLADGPDLLRFIAGRAVRTGNDGPLKDLLIRGVGQTVN